MTTQLEIARADAKEIAVTKIDPPHGGPFYKLAVKATSGSSVAVYLTKEERGRLLKALMEPKK